MKRTTLFLLIIVGITALYAQPSAPVPLQMKKGHQYSEHINTEIRLVFSDESIPIWRPKIYKQSYFEEGVMYDSVWWNFSYTQDGRLKEQYVDDYYFGNTPSRQAYQFNLNYPEISTSLIDTWTLYMKRNGIWKEKSRDYYEYSFSGEDIYQVRILQEWNGAGWKDTYKYVDEYSDSYTFYLLNQYKATASGDWELAQWIGDSLFYDNEGNVSTMIRYMTSSQQGYDNEPYIKMEYFREQGEEAYNAYNYYKYDREEKDWVLTEIGFDIEWSSWHEFGHHEDFQTAIKWRWPREGETWKEYYYQYYELDDDISWGYSTFTQSDYWDEYIRAEYHDERYDEYGNRVLSVYGKAYDDPYYLDSSVIVNTHLHYYDSGGRGLERSEWRAIKYYYSNPSDSLIGVETAISEVLEFVDCTQVSILEPEANSASSFDFYPNPARDQIQISAAEPLQEIELFDISGRLIKTAAAKQAETVVDISNLAPGVYLLKARLKNGAVRTEKLIIQ